MAGIGYIEVASTIHCHTVGELGVGERQYDRAAPGLGRHSFKLTARLLQLVLGSFALSGMLGRPFLGPSCGRSEVVSLIDVGRAAMHLRVIGDRDGRGGVHPRPRLRREVRHLVRGVALHLHRRCGRAR